jgi:rod shape-determining protein MreD
MAQTSIVRAAILVAFAAVLEATLAPYLTLGWVAPRFTILAVVFAASGLRELPAVLLGFFGGILIDALGGGLFGVGALGGLAAGMLASRTGAARRKGGEKFLLAQVVAVAVAAYDLVGLVAARLAESEAPPVDAYVVAGALPDAVLNGLLAYLVGGWLLALVRQKEDR